MSNEYLKYYSIEPFRLERQYKVKVQVFFFTLVLISLSAQGGQTLIRSLFQTGRILLYPITAMLDIIAMAIVLLSKIVYKIVIWIFEGIKQIIISFFKMIIKSVLGRLLATLSIAAGIYIIYTIITTGSWITSLNTFSKLWSDLVLYFF